MRILIKEIEDYILCEAPKKDDNKKVIFHITTYKYFNESYNAYDKVEKGFKIARKHLGVKRLLKTLPLPEEYAKKYAKENNIKIIEVENVLPKNVKKMKGVTENY